MDMNDKIKKTRNRVPISCDHCRKRKLKCDRQKPCGNCVKSQCETLCKYVVQQKQPTTSIPRANLNNEIIKLKLHINKLERIIQMNNIDLSAYQNMMPQLLCDDDDNENNNEIEDPMVSLSEKFDSMIIKENKVVHSGTTSYVTFIHRDRHLQQVFEGVTLRHRNIYQNYKARMKMKASDYNLKFDDNHLQWLIATTSTDLPTCEVEQKTRDIYGLDPKSSVLIMQTRLLLDTIKEINRVLPPLYVVNALIEHFFEYVYPLLPLIDENIFRDDLSCVLVVHNDGTCSVSIAHIQNASTISLFLLVLRFAYLAVNIDDPRSNSPALIKMINDGHVVDSNLAIYSKSLLMSLPCEDAIFKKITLRNIQVLTLLRMYQTYSPEMHEESKENSLTLTLIIQMCRSFGANRDLSKFPDIFEDEREITIWKRLFYKLMTMDVHNAFEYGCPLIISDNEYDVKLPKISETDLELLKNFKKGEYVNKSTADIKKIAVEHAINKDIALEYETILLVREGLNEFQNFKHKTKRSNLVSIHCKIQKFVDTKMPSIWELIQPVDENSKSFDRMFNISRVKTFDTKLATQNFLMAFYYLLFLNDEEGEESDSMSNTPDSDISESSEDSSTVSPKTLYLARATEIAFTILKINSDYVKYMDQRSQLPTDCKQYDKYKLFSANCETFLFNKIMNAMIRPFFFLSSIFLKNLDVKSMQIELLIQNFSNTIDASVVLSWFNISVSIPGNPDALKDVSEVSVLVFQYVKELFFDQYKFKDRFYMSWRTQMIIKLFVNYFAESNQSKCTEYLQPYKKCDFSEKSLNSSASPLTLVPPMLETENFIPNNISNIVGSVGFSLDNLKNNDINNDSDTIATRNAIEDSKFMEDFLNNIVEPMNTPNQVNDLSQLLYNDASKSLVENMVAEANLQSNFNKEINIFGNLLPEQTVFDNIIKGFTGSNRHDSNTSSGFESMNNPNGVSFSTSSTGSIATPDIFESFTNTFQ